VPEPDQYLGPNQAPRPGLAPGWESTPDRIELRGLRFSGTHGALAVEAESPQPFEVDLDLFADLSAAGRSDDLRATVDYGRLCEVVRSVIEGAHITLLERLAEQVAEGVLAIAGPLAQGVAVSVRKLRPPVPVEMASAGVRIVRHVAEPVALRSGQRA
jgi:dihydroneopterin aldolase